MVSLVLTGTIFLSICSPRVAPEPIVTSHDLHVTFVNEDATDEFQVLWMGPGDPKLVGTVPPAGGVLNIVALEGHSYLLRSPSYFDRHVKTSVQCSGASPQHWCAGHVGHTFFLLGVPDVVPVDCRLKGKADDVLHIQVFPDWAPRGAARFLQLVRERFFDGVAITHVKPHHVAQFGIGTTQELREKWQSATIPDDPARGMAFEPGMLSFSSLGANARTTELFFVMPDRSPAALGLATDAVCEDKDSRCESWAAAGECTTNPGFMLEKCKLSCKKCPIGGKPSDTPFAKVADSSGLAALSRLRSYGDNGPERSRIISEGYEYLDRLFPDLDRIESCRRTDVVV